jgi:hypothetical protein
MKKRLIPSYVKEFYPPNEAAFVKPSPGILQSDAELAQWVRYRATAIRPIVLFMHDMSTYEMTCFQIACVLIASSLIGANEDRIAEVLGCDPKRVAEWGRNLRENGTWLSDGGVVDSPWFDQRDGTASLIMDVFIAKGELKLRMNPLSGEVDCWLLCDT